MHAINGILGMLMTAFMAKPAHVALVVGEGGCGGIFYTKEGWMQLAMQVLGEATTHQVSLLCVVALLMHQVTVVLRHTPDISCSQVCCRRMRSSCPVELMLLWQGYCRFRALSSAGGC